MLLIISAITILGIMLVSFLIFLFTKESGRFYEGTTILNLKQEQS